jgi:hypothetical protein
MPRINLIEKELNENFKKAIIGVIVQLTVFFTGATLLIMSLGWQLGLGIVLMTMYLKAENNG